jgi:predicted DNA-binding transcriptional regulator AlpA
MNMTGPLQISGRTSKRTDLGAGTDRLLDAAGVALKLLRSRSWFYQHRAELEAANFPRPLPIVDRWDPAAIDRWIADKDKITAATTEHRAREKMDAAFGL